VIGWSRSATYCARRSPSIARDFRRERNAGAASVRANWLAPHRISDTREAQSLYCAANMGQMSAQDRIERIGAAITAVLIGLIGYRLRNVFPWPSITTFAVSVVLASVMGYIVDQRRRRRHDGR